MKKFLLFTLIVLVVFSSTAAFAVEGDIIHTGLKKLFKASDDYRGLSEAILSGVDKSKFYREDTNGNYVNILAEEEAQLDYLDRAIAEANIDITDSEALNDFIQKPELLEALSKISKGENPKYPNVLYKFDEIPDVGNKEDYYGPSAKVEVEKIDMGVLKKGDNFVGAIKINELTEGNYKIIVLDGPLNKVYEDDNFPSSKEYTPLDDFVVVKEDSSFSNFKKYVYLFKINDGKIESYNEFVVDENNISIPPTLLMVDTHYIGPVKGITDGTTQFTKLEFENFTFKYVIDKEIVPIPIADTEISDLSSSIVSGTEIKASDGDCLLLAAVDNENKVKGYAKFFLTEDNIKGITPPEFNISPQKGNAPDTTMVKEITLEDKANKWMYAIGIDLDDPVLDKDYLGAEDYTLGNDIKAKPGETLMIFETDDTGKVKRFGKAKLNENVIKASLAKILEKDTNFRGPIKGDKPGTTKFEFLNYEGLKFIYFVSEKEITAPEMDSIVNTAVGKNIVTTGISTADIEVFQEDNPILKSNTGFLRHMLVVAMDKDNKAKAYGKFELNNLNVRLPLAEKLNKNPYVNFSTPKKGTLPNTTMIETLDNKGLDSSVSSFRYKVVDSNMEVEYNDKITGVSELRQGVNIPVSLNLGDEKYLLILAVDSAGRTKYYASVKLDDKNVRSQKANELAEGTHYKKPIPGSYYNSTKFPFLQLPKGATKWMYKISDTSHGLVETGIAIDDAKDLNPWNVDISPIHPNEYLLLLATDDGKVVAYVEIRLNDSNVKGGKADEILDINYVVEKGSKPSTTRIVNLDTAGLKKPDSTRWKVKWVAEEPTKDEDKPYFGSVVDGMTGYYREGTDILVTQTNEGKYGYILLLATDGLGKTKAYKYIPLDSSNVREHAPIIEAELKPGTDIDTTTIIGLSNEKKYKYIITNNSLDVPSIGDNLPINPIDYSIGDDIKVKFGDHLTVFELDDEGKIARYKAFIIDPLTEPSVVKQGIGKLSLNDKTEPLDTLLEGEVSNGGKKLLITLEEANWVDGLDKNSDLRNKLFNGLMANNQAGEWNKVIVNLVNHGFGNIQVSGNNLTIALVSTPNYDIYDEQEVTMVVHPDLVQGAINPIYANGKITIKPTVRSSISGDFVDDIVRKKDIEEGGKTIVITLGDGNWKIDFDENKLLAGFTSDGPNWDKISKKLKPQNIIRSSNTEIKIKLPPIKVDWDWGTKTEIINVGIDKELLIDAVENVVATPRFKLYPDILTIKGEATIEGEPTNEVMMQAPEGKEVHDEHNKWRIKVTEGTLKDDLSIKDLTLTGLPKGLTATATKAKNNIIDIEVSGKSSTSISDTQVFAIINGTAIIEPNSIGSEAIELHLKMAEGMKFEDVKYRIDGAIRFTGITPEIEYSINSTNGTNGDWKIGTNSEVTLPLEPITVYIREKTQPLVFKKFEFENGKAPENININSYSYQEDGKVDVTLRGIDKENMEYSVNGGAKYTPFIKDDDTISLAKDDDLRVRYKAVEGQGDSGKLPSKPTPKLNGEYLGDVVLAAGDGKILGTNTNMEYSLGSTNGTDGIWENAKAKETPVVFNVDNKVYIREKSSTINYRYLGTISQANKPDLTYVYYNVASGKIANMSGQDLEYRIAGGSWNTIWKNTDNFGVDFKPGALEFRIKAVGDVLASLPVTKDTVPAQQSMPVVKIDDVENKVLSINGLDEWKDFEYRINPNSATPWSDGQKLRNEDLSGDKTVEIRIKATTETLPSKVSVVKFTKNLDLNLVALSAYAEPPVLNGTTNVMEYRITTVNSTTSWTKATNGDTALPSWFKDYYDNKLIIKIEVRDGRVGQQNNTNTIFSGTPSEEANFDKISYKFEGGKIVFSGISNLMEYSVDPKDGVDDSWKAGNGSGIEFKDEPINLYVRLAKVPSVFKQFSIDRPAAPDGVSIKTYEYRANGDSLKVVLDGFKENMEYSIDGGSTWSTSGKLDNLTKDSDLRVRYKFADGTSSTGKLSSIPTSKLNNVYLGKVSIDANGERLLNTDVNMEYKIDSADGTKGEWTTATSQYTMVSLNLKDELWIREKDNDDHKWKVGVIGQESKPDLNYVYYNIALNKIANMSGQNLEYKVAGGRWIPINANKDDLDVAFTHGPLEFRKVAKGTNLASLPETLVVIKAPATGPVVDYDDVGNKVEEIDGLTNWGDYEYRIVNGDSPEKWIPATELNKEDFSGDIKIDIRKKATKEDLPSQIRQITFTTNLPLKHVRLSTHVSPLELNGTTTQMEYNIYLKNGKKTGWKDCNPDVNGNTKLPEWLKDINTVEKIQVRDKNQQENQYTVYE